MLGSYSLPPLAEVQDTLVVDNSDRLTGSVEDLGDAPTEASGTD